MKKLIKRGFAALLALTLALGMSVSAFAVEGTADTKTAVAKKDYQQINPNTTSPAEDSTLLWRRWARPTPPTRTALR